AKLSLSLPITARGAAPDPAASSLFASARSRQPRPAPFETLFVSEPHDYRLLVPASAIAELRAPTGMFFPDDGSLIDHAAEPRMTRPDGGLEIKLTKASPSVPAPATLDGVLVLRGEDGRERAFEVNANPAPMPATGSRLDWWQALLLAFLGGII